MRYDRGPTRASFAWHLLFQQLLTWRLKIRGTGMEYGASSSYTRGILAHPAWERRPLSPIRRTSGERGFPQNGDQSSTHRADRPPGTQRRTHVTRTHRSGTMHATGSEQSRRWCARRLHSIVAALALILTLVNLLTADQGRIVTGAHAARTVSVISGEQYRPGDPDAYLDVYIPQAAIDSSERLPVLVWTHGGGWFSGSRTDAAPYFQRVASAGYVVVSLDYSLAPEHRYPRPVVQVNDALAYIETQAARFRLDPERIVLAGDSAGAQIASQVAIVITDPGYAGALGIVPTISPNQLRGTVLFCGIYDMAAFLGADGKASGLFDSGLNTAIETYIGDASAESPARAEMSTVNHVTPAFPPTFISGGNADPLTEDQSLPLAAALEGQGVDATSLFFPADHEPGLGHEYQFFLDTAGARTALNQLVAFLNRVTGS